MDSYAIIFDWRPNEPTYHGFDDERLNSQDVHYSTDYTRCGRIASQYNHETGKYTEPGDWFPIKHALKFARGCRVCFPEDDS